MLTKSKFEQQQMMIALRNLSRLNLDIFTKHVIGKDIQVLKPFIEAIDEAGKIDGYQEYKKGSDELFYKYAKGVQQVPDQSKVQGKIPDKDIPLFNEEAEKLKIKFATVIAAMEKQEKEYGDYLKSTDNIDGLLKIRLSAHLETTVDISFLVDLIDVIGADKDEIAEKKDKKKRLN